MTWLRIYLFVLIVMFLPSCYHLSTRKEFAQINEKTEMRTGKSIVLKDVDRLVIEQKKLEEETQNGISREEVTKFAIQNNPGLQAVLQEIAIAKAEVLQAGLLTNPDFDLVSVLLPDVDVLAVPALENSVATTTTFQLSDFWRLPFQTAVACFQLKQTFAEVELRILDIKKEAQIAYNSVLFHIERLNVFIEFVKNIEKAYKELENITNKKSLQLDYSLAGIILGNESNKRETTKVSLLRSYAGLRAITGMLVNDELLKPSESFFDNKPFLPDLYNLLDQAVEVHPRVIAAVYKLRAAQKALSLERASVFSNVSAGLVTDDPKDGPVAFGPVIKLEVPLFDANQAQIARARFVIDQSEQELLEVRRHVAHRIIAQYYLVKRALIRLDYFEELVRPALERGIDFVVRNLKDYATNKDLDYALLMQSLDLFYLTKVDYLDFQRDALNEFAELEFAVGRRLSEFGGGLRHYERKTDEELFDISTYPKHLAEQLRAMKN